MLTLITIFHNQHILENLPKKFTKYKELAAHKRGRPKVSDWLQLTLKLVVACSSLVVKCLPDFDVRTTIRIAFVAFGILLWLADFAGKVHRYAAS